MKYAFLTLLLVFGLCNSYSQQRPTSCDTIVYQSLFSNLGFSQEVPVFSRTSLADLKKVDLKKTDLKKWLKQGTVSGWKDFFDAINLDTVSEFEFKSAIGSHPIVKKMFIQNEKHEPQRFLQLSPIIYSDDKKFALISVLDWSGPESSANTVYLMQLKDGKWRIAKFLLLAVS